VILNLICGSLSISVRISSFGSLDRSTKINWYGSLKSRVKSEVLVHLSVVLKSPDMVHSLKMLKSTLLVHLPFLLNQLPWFTLQTYKIFSRWFTRIFCKIWVNGSFDKRVEIMIYGSLTHHAKSEGLVQSAILLKFM
jgi:hypothetical protein